MQAGVALWVDVVLERFRRPSTRTGVANIVSAVRLDARPHLDVGGVYGRIGRCESRAHSSRREPAAGRIRHRPSMSVRPR
jgi:hypothetical protein